MRLKDGALNRLLLKLPLIAALAVALMWGLIYLFFGRLSGMWGMFDRGFPFLTAWIIGIHPGAMTVWEGMFFASLDGLIFGWFFGSLLRLFFSEK
jgi:hypothetical protein